MKHEKVPPQTTRNHEDDAEVIGQLLVRFIERAMDRVDEIDELTPYYSHVFCALMDVGQEELKQYALDYALLLYSDERITRNERFAFEVAAQSKV